MAPSSLRSKTVFAVSVTVGMLLLFGVKPAEVSSSYWETADGDDYLAVNLPVFSGQVYMVAGGAGLHDTGSGRITLTVPTGATIEAAYLYWGGHDGHQPPDNTGDDNLTLVVDSNPSVSVIGGLIGITIELSHRYRFVYRAEVTEHVLAGTHDYNLSDFDDALLNDNGERYGAGLIVVYSQSSLPQARIQIADGVDYFLEAKGHPASQLLHFNITPLPIERTASVVVFVGGVAEDQATAFWYQTEYEGPESEAINKSAYLADYPEGSIIDAPGAVDYNNSSSDVAGVDTDPFYSADGAEYDRANFSIPIPANGTFLDLQIESQGDSPYGKRSASGSWAMCALYLEEPSMGSIGDRVWDDVNGDGVQDPGEQGLDGITVDAENVAKTWSSSKVTGDNPGTPELEHGWFDFTNLPPDDYIIRIDTTSLPPNYAGYPPLLTTANEPQYVSLGLGEDFNGADFGYMENPIPVELMSFSAIMVGTEVHLSWATASETENMGYNIYRSESEIGHYRKINETLISGAGNSTTLQQYAYIDRDIESDKSYYYKLSDITYYGESVFHGPIAVSASSAPVAYELFQNYPNPFSAGGRSAFGGNPETTIQFDMKIDGQVQIHIYNMTGQLVRTLVDAWMSQGKQSTVWDGKDNAGKVLPSGTYFCIMRVNDFEISRKIVFAK